MTSLVQRLRALLRPQPDYNDVISDVDPSVLRIYEQVRPYTMTNLLRVNALVHGVQHVIRRNVSGAFVECGVWRGGSVLAMLMKLQQMGVADREIWLYDTFEGMTVPTEADTSRFSEPALPAWHKAAAARRRAWRQVFAPEKFNFEQVQRTILSSGYPPRNIRFVRGDVLQTIPAQAPGQIALLRLDTDWYESTRHELTHLYPRLAEGGVLIVDDYGHWEGCRKAVDEYFADGGAPALLLNRIDYTARLAIKH